MMNKVIRIGQFENGSFGSYVRGAASDDVVEYFAVESDMVSAGGNVSAAKAFASRRGAELRLIEMTGDETHMIVRHVGGGSTSGWKKVAAGPKHVMEHEIARGKFANRGCHLWTMSAAKKVGLK